VDEAEHVTRDDTAAPEPAAAPAAPNTPTLPDNVANVEPIKTDRSKPSDEMLARIEDAARMRAEGNTWAQIAERFGYKDATSARNTIAGDYEATWSACWTWARENLRPVYEAEAVATLRELTHPVKPVYGSDGKPKKDDDGKVVHEERKEQVRESASHALLAHVGRMQAQDINLKLRGNVGHHSTRLDELEDEDLDAILAAAAATRAARDEGA